MAEADDDDMDSEEGDNSSYMSSSSSDEDEEAPSDEHAAASPSDNVLLVVTGASRGLGKAIARVFCEQCNVSTAILVARSGDKLHEAGKELKQVSPGTQLVHHAMDLQLLDDLDGLLDMLYLHMFAPQRFSRLVFVNNAGSLGHLGPATTMSSLADMRGAIDLNVTSALWVSMRFAKFLEQNAGHPPATLVNISSLAAIQPFPTMALYAAGKAARDMYHASLAKENPGMRIVNYAPGPLETDMTEEIRACKQLDAGLKPAFQKKLEDPMDSARRLVELVKEDTFESGSHVDYYDLCT